MYCHKCGTQNAESASFCKSCGADLTIAHQAASTKAGGGSGTAPSTSGSVRSRGVETDSASSGQDDPTVARFQSELLSKQLQSGSAYVQTGGEAYTPPRGDRLGAVHVIGVIVAIVGWITLFGGVFGILAMGSQISSMLGPRSGGTAIVAVLTSLVPLVLIALGPFYLWAILKSMREIHAQGNQVLDGLDRLNASIRAAASSAASAPAVGTAPAADRVTENGKPASDPSLG